MRKKFIGLEKKTDLAGGESTPPPDRGHVP